MRVFIFLSTLLAVNVAYAAFNNTEVVANALPDFKYKKLNVVNVDVTSINAHVVIDEAAGTCLIESQLSYFQPQAGAPMLGLTEAFDIEFAVNEIFVNDKKLHPKYFISLDHPKVKVLKDTYKKVSTINKKFAAGNYLLRTKNDCYVSDKKEDMHFNLFLSDRSFGKHYLPKYFPAPLQHDKFQLQIKMTWLNGKKIQVFTNGETTQIAENSYVTTFPAWYTSMSPFYEVSNCGMQSVSAIYNGIEKSIPVIVYGGKADQNALALKDSLELLSELEGIFGAFPHDSFLLRIETEIWGGDGMEYAGAAQVQHYKPIYGYDLKYWRDVLGHELVHNWYARSVMPKTTRSEFFDELIAYWWENGMKASEKKDYVPDYMAYLVGGAEKFQNLLRDFAAAYKHQLIDIDDFVLFAKTNYGVDYSEILIDD